jgi:hypothetical protein
MEFFLGALFGLFLGAAITVFVFSYLADRGLL